MSHSWTFLNGSSCGDQSIASLRCLDILLLITIAYFLLIFLWKTVDKTIYIHGPSVAVREQLKCIAAYCHWQLTNWYTNFYSTFSLYLWSHNLYKCILKSISKYILNVFWNVHKLNVWEKFPNNPVFFSECLPHRLKMLKQWLTNRISTCILL